MGCFFVFLRWITGARTRREVVADHRLFRPFRAKWTSPCNPRQRTVEDAGPYIFCAGLRVREPACGSQIRGRGKRGGFAKQMVAFSHQDALSFSNRHSGLKITSPRNPQRGFFIFLRWITGARNAQPQAGREVACDRLFRPFRAKWTSPRNPQRGVFIFLRWITGTRIRLRIADPRARQGRRFCEANGGMAAKPPSPRKNSRTEVRLFSLLYEYKSNMLAYAAGVTTGRMMFGTLPYSTTLSTTTLPPSSTWV